MFKNRGFMDKLYFLNFIVVWVFVCLCYVLTLFSGYMNVTDLSVVSIGIPSAFTELGIHTGFIVWKAQRENCRKFKDVNESSEFESEEM